MTSQLLPRRRSAWRVYWRSLRTLSRSRPEETKDVDRVEKCLNDSSVQLGYLKALLLKHTLEQDPLQRAAYVSVQGVRHQSTAEHTVVAGPQGQSYHPLSTSITLFALVIVAENSRQRQQTVHQDAAQSIRKKMQPEFSMAKVGGEAVHQKDPQANQPKKKRKQKRNSPGHPSFRQQSLLIDAPLPPQNYNYIGPCQKHRTTSTRSVTEPR